MGLQFNAPMYLPCGHGRCPRWDIYTGTPILCMGAAIGTLPCDSHESRVLPLVQQLKALAMEAVMPEVL